MRVKYGVGDMEHLHHQLHMHTIIYVDCAYPLYATTVRVHCTYCNCEKSIFTYELYTAHVTYLSKH